MTTCTCPHRAPRAPHEPTCPSAGRFAGRARRTKRKSYPHKGVRVEVVVRTEAEAEAVRTYARALKASKIPTCLSVQSVLAVQFVRTNAGKTAENVGGLEK